MSKAADEGTKTVTRRISLVWGKYQAGDLMYEKKGMFGSRTKAKNWFEITKDVYYQHVHDITEDEAQAEGVEPIMGSYIEGLKVIWKKINGPLSWPSNPLVLVINFRKITKEDAFEKLGQRWDE